MRLGCHVVVIIHCLRMRLGCHVVVINHSTRMRLGRLVDVIKVNCYLFLPPRANRILKSMLATTCQQLIQFFLATPRANNTCYLCLLPHTNS